MRSDVRKAKLTPAKKRLLKLMQQINFGRIEGLSVHENEPVFNPPPVVVRDIKFGGENDSRRELGADDFTLKAQVVELFAQFDCLGSGTVDVLEVKHGLPFRMSIKEAAWA